MRARNSARKRRRRRRRRAGGRPARSAEGPGRSSSCFHHQPTLTFACYNQADATPCYNPETITDANGDQFATSGHPGMYLDQKTGKLYVYATRAVDSTAGVVCIDTTLAATNPNPFCGYTALTPAGQGPLSESGISATSVPMLVGHGFYSFNYVANAGVSGAENQMLCFDVSTDAACANQPYAVALPAGATFQTPAYYHSPGFPVPGTAAIGGKLIVPVNGTNTGGTFNALGCMDTATNAPCTGSWPALLTFNYVGYDGSPFPLLNNGVESGVCTPSAGAPSNLNDYCFDLNGNSVATPPNLSSAIPANDVWNGPGLVIGNRVYVAGGTDFTGQDAVYCYDYTSQAECQNFLKTFTGLSYLYTVNPDPQRPTCIWVNSDSGPDQIQNFDAFTAGGCDQNGQVRVLASQFVVPQQACYPTSYNSLQILSPDPTTYNGGTVTVEDLDGNAIAGATNLPINNGTVDLTGVNLTGVNGLPQFLITLNGTTGSPTAVTVKLTWTANYNPACNGGGQTVTPQATTTTTSLSGGGQSGPNITVPPNTQVTDQATVAGQDASQATGSVSYTWYSDNKCTLVASGPDQENITTPGTIPASAPVTLAPGTYYAVASYNGDAGNSPSPSSCGAETLTVSSPVNNGPSIDGQPATGQSNRSATAKVSAASGDWLLAFVRGDSPYGAGNTATVSGGGLTWTLVGRENRALGDAEVWKAQVTGAALANAPITAKLVKYPNYDAVITVIAFKNATGIGATSSAHAMTGAPTATLTTTQNNSWVFAAGDDWLASVNRTPPAGQTIEEESTDAAGDTYWVQSTNAPTPTAGTTVTINDLGPTTDPFDLFLVEVL